MQLALVSIFALVCAVLAQQPNGPNAFNNPVGFSLTAGKPTTITWNPTTPGTVTLKLRSGANSDLNQGTVIEGILVLFLFFLFNDGAGVFPSHKTSSPPPVPTINNSPNQRNPLSNSLLSPRNPSLLPFSRPSPLHQRKEKRKIRG